MREVPLPPPAFAPLQRSVAAVLAAILELELADVPLPPADHPQPWTVWRNWLAGRGLGLVPVLAPADFNWPGPWLALLRADEAGGAGRRGRVRIAARARVEPRGREPDVRRRRGRLRHRARRRGVVGATGRRRRAPIAPADIVELLALAAAAEAPMTVVEQATARAGRGLQGDRYCDARGTFSDPHATGNDITLIEAEVLDALAPAQSGLAAQDARRNVVTRGIDLNALVETRFTIGEVRLRRPAPVRAVRPSAAADRPRHAARPGPPGRPARRCADRRRHPPRRRRPARSPLPPTRRFRARHHGLTWRVGRLQGTAKNPE